MSKFGCSVRTIFVTMIAAGSALLLAVSVYAQDAEPELKRHHALSLIGEPEYGPDFKHFKWVNPDAPKGGKLVRNVEGTFDNLNPFTIKGVAAAGLGLTYDTLMATSPDEFSAEYGLVAEWVSFPDDFSKATFGIRTEAKFNDGTPITPDDIIFSLTELKKAHPLFGKYYKNVVKAEKTGERQVTFTFDSTGNRELPQILGQLPVLSKQYWQGNDKNGEPRDLAKSSSEAVLGSGPYRIKKVDIGKTVVYERVANYWAKDLPVSKGQWNFDEMVFKYFKDQTGSFEEFKLGDADLWLETSSQAWATKFSFPAINSGQVKKEEIPVAGVARMQAFVFNTRREKFKDPRVRRAFNYAFDFESLNKNVLYNQYIRVGSFFDNSEMKASGLPEGRELEILNEVKADVPPEVFTTEFKNPVGGPENMRENLRKATELLNSAGWQVTDKVISDPDCGFFCGLMKTLGLGSDKTERVLRDSTGKEMDVEILLNQSLFERIVLPYIADLKKLGIKARARVVDPAQFAERERSRDFDMIVDSFPQSMSPGNEQRDFWGSSAADVQGSRNSIGIKNKAVDLLIDKIVFAKDRAELVAATKALDRVLLWNHYVVPQWHYPYVRVAYWDKFGRPETLPKLTPAFMQVWWIDPAKAEALQKGSEK